MVRKLPKKLQIDDFKKIAKAYNPDLDISEIDFQMYVAKGDTTRTNREALQEAYPSVIWSKEEYRERTGKTLRRKDIKEIEERIEKQQEFQSQKEEVIEDLEVEKNELEERLEKLKKEKIPPEYQEQVENIKDRIDNLESKLEGIETGGVTDDELSYLETKMEGKFKNLENTLKELVKEIAKEREKEKEERKKKEVGAGEVIGGVLGGKSRRKPEIEISDRNKDQIELVAKAMDINPDKFMDLIKKLLQTRYLKNLTPWLILGVVKGLAQLKRKAKGYERRKGKAAKVLGIKIEEQKDQVNYAARQVSRATHVVRDAGFKFKR